MLLKWLAELGIQQSSGTDEEEGHPAGFGKIEDELKRLEAARSVGPGRPLCCDVKASVA